jgi:hypothetical protein
MVVTWTKHARLRYAERALKYNLTYGDLELELKKQRVKLKQNNNIKTIFQINNSFFTAIKKETNDYLLVLTVWESNEDEVDLWKKK